MLNSLVLPKALLPVPPKMTVPLPFKVRSTEPADVLVTDPFITRLVPPDALRKADGEDAFVGLLENHPVFVKAKHGDVVVFTRDEILDWNFVDGNKLIGKRREVANEDL